ncbi:hypothetical protein DMH04_47900 [Kibdelosporangium aridum]|uniref:Uncharacterized protein n=1 Tax=Kibdelosporangium aridum TaxID=2030 RepID=A0A428YK10_KIBAR|nr:hypothetical protein [Kibdelosporangium aridum]RSM67903.1 hypothetical protein DMH04_47900 [Kibdelosporangium aridum]
MLRHSNACWLRADALNGAGVDVYEGPGQAGRQTDGARLRYWLNGADRLRRVEARIGSSTDPALVDLTVGAAAFSAIPEHERAASP